MSKIGVGKEIVTYCTKCKLDLGHIIAVMKDEETPLKVECRTCGAIHSFKAVKAKKAPAKKRAPRKSAIEKITEQWKTGMKKSKGDPTAYTIKTQFEKGQSVEHKLFGIGYVERTVDADKVEVIFETEIKILVHNK